MHKNFYKAFYEVFNPPIRNRAEIAKLISKGFAREPLRTFYPIWLKRNNLYKTYRVTQLTWFVLSRTLDEKWTTPAMIVAKYSKGRQYKIRDEYKNSATFQTLIQKDKQVNGRYWFNPEKLLEFQAAYADYQPLTDRKALRKFVKNWLRKNDLFINKRIYAISWLLFENSLYDCWTSLSEIAWRLLEYKKSEIDYLGRHNLVLSQFIHYKRSTLRYSFDGLSPTMLRWQLSGEKQAEILSLFLENHVNPIYQKLQKRKDPNTQLLKNIIKLVAKAALAGQALTLTELATTLFKPKSYRLRDDLRNHPELKKIIEKDPHKRGRYWFDRGLLEKIKADFKRKTLS